MLQYVWERRIEILCTFIVLGTISLYLVVFLLSHFPRKPYPEEKEYLTVDEAGTVKREPLPTDPCDDIQLSVVVPSYNETGRIATMLDEAIGCLQKIIPNKWEILIVDDGSEDGTTDYCLKLSHDRFKLKPGQLRVLKFKYNRGKGGAVKQGMLHIRGRYGLFADADGASKFEDVQKLLDVCRRLEINAKGEPAPAMVIGSRAHMVNTDAVIKRSLLRNTLMYGFHCLVYIFGIRVIRDTQCGFKLFNRQAIDLIFPYLHTEGWIFDVEVLLLGMKKKVKFEEIPVTWHEVEGSKMTLAIDSLMMAKDLVVIRMAYLLGIYKANVEC